MRPMTSVHCHPTNGSPAQLDAADPLARFREQFLHPARPRRPSRSSTSAATRSACSRKAARAFVAAGAGRLGPPGRRGPLPRPDALVHRTTRSFREPGARLVGARPGEVVLMNSLTVNLHLMLATFYRPTPERYKILIDEPTFPSDRYAVPSQLRHHGCSMPQAESDCSTAAARGRASTCCDWRTSRRCCDARRPANRRGAAQRRSTSSPASSSTCARIDGGGPSARLHRRLRPGPRGRQRAAAAARLGRRFRGLVHLQVPEQRARRGRRLLRPRAARREPDLPRLAGWWGNDPAHALPHAPGAEFVPRAGADGWQVSNPPILAMAPLRRVAGAVRRGRHAGPAGQVGAADRLPALSCSIAMPSSRFEVITPRDADAARLPAVAAGPRPAARACCKRLQADGVVCDFREPERHPRRAGAAVQYLRGGLAVRQPAAAGESCVSALKHSESRQDRLHG